MNLGQWIGAEDFQGVGLRLPPGSPIPASEGGRAKSRKDAIVDLLEKKSRVREADIADTLQISRSHTRHILTALCVEGRVRRTGALRNRWFEKNV